MIKRTLLTTVVTLMIASPTYAQAAGSNDAMLKELQAIRELLKQLVIQTAPQERPQEAPPPAVPTTAKLDDVRGYFMGKMDAPITMVEFTDLQCPYCKMFHEFTFEKLKREYIDTGKVRFITRDNPLGMHPYAHPAAMSSRCAGDQGKFWEVRRALQLSADKLDLAFIKNTARESGIDMTAYQACMDTERFAADIKRDADAAAASGFTGTPAFVIGRTTANGIEGDVVSGALPWKVFEDKLAAWLSPVGKTK